MPDFRHILCRGNGKKRPSRRETLMTHALPPNLEELLPLAALALLIAGHAALILLGGGPARGRRDE
jgi:hypothetical protein